MRKINIRPIECRLRSLGRPIKVDSRLRSERNRTLYRLAELLPLCHLRLEIELCHFLPGIQPWPPQQVLVSYASGCAVVLQLHALLREAASQCVVACVDRPGVVLL